MADNTMNQGGRQGGSDQGRSGKTGQEGRQESQRSNMGQGSQEGQRSNMGNQEQSGQQGQRGQEKGVLLSRENPIRDVRRKGRMCLASRIWSLILKKKEEGKADLISLHLTGRE